MPGPARHTPRHLQAVPPARFQVRLTVPRRGGVVEWLHVSGEFERRLARQQSESVIAPHVESQTRRGRTYVAVKVLMTVLAPDVGEALATALGAFRQAAGDDEAGWDMASARAEVWPEP